MADPVALQARPPQGMSLGDMVNMANAVQSYQQAQQMNPLLLQQQQQVVNQAAAMNPLLLQQQEQVVNKGGIDLRTAQQGENERQALIKFLSVPENYMTDGKIDMRKAGYAIPQIAPLTGNDVLTKLASLSKANIEVQGAKQALTQSQRQIIAQRLGILGRLNIEAPEQYQHEMTLLKRENPDNPELHNLADAYSALFDNIEPGPHVAQGAVREVQSLLSPPEQETAFKPAVTTADLGAGIQPLAVTPSIGANAPTIQQLGEPLQKSVAPGSFVEINGIKHKVNADGTVTPVSMGGGTAEKPLVEVKPQLTNMPTAQQRSVSQLKTPDQVEKEINSNLNIPAARKREMIESYKKNYPNALATEKANFNQQPTSTTQKQIPPPSADIQRVELVKQDMPVPQGSLRQMNEQQKARYEAGQKLFSDSAAAAANASDQDQIIANLRRYSSQAQSSKPGQLLRAAGKYVQGNEELDSLLKNLAANQIAQSKIMGGADSVNAQKTFATANGSEDIDPKTLNKILDTAAATNAATKMFNQGLQQYAGRDSLNSPIHANNFVREWQSNYDPRIFLNHVIKSQNLTDEQKKAKMIEQIGPIVGDNNRMLKQKQYNLLRLQQGDF